jgi:glycosyltransferase involved in cell wall biosynthesis
VRVAYHSPLPPSTSGIADYSALLLPALERRVDVEVVQERRRRRRGAPDVRLYHVGNSPEAHGWILDALRESRGLVVLHELVIHHLVAGVTLARGDGPGYLDAMQREAGVVGRLLAHGVIDGLIPPLWERRSPDFPLAGEALAHADGVIVHSRYVEDGVRSAGYVGPVFRVPHPAWPIPAVEPWTPPTGPADALFVVLGHVNPQKRIGSVLAAFARVRESLPGARLVIAGGSSGVDLAREVETAGVAEAVDLLGFVDEELLWRLLAAADACVSLRSPTMGETSGVALRALSIGTPLVVSDVGWFAELPDAVAIKVPVGEGEIDALGTAMRLLASDGARRDAMARAGRNLAEGEHAVDRVADLYAAACEELAGAATVQTALVEHIAPAAADVGIGAEELRDIATAMSEVTRDG